MTRLKINANKAGVKNITPCPKCGNDKDFVVNSYRHTDGTCDVWIECHKCGYNPEIDKLWKPYEDVWGGCDDANARAALYFWSDALREGN